MKRPNEKHGESKTRIYRIWAGMIARCHNEKRHDYPRYGGRGVSVCQEWRDSFTAFRDWAMAHGYADSMSIDRRKSERGYSPGNCRWVPATAQNWNRQKPRSANADTPFIGVTLDPDRGRWRATICTNGKQRRIGRFRTQLEAALAYDDAAFAERPGLSRLNFPERKRAIHACG